VKTNGRKTEDINLPRKEKGAKREKGQRITNKVVF
jgi:hypothetical protein